MAKGLRWAARIIGLLEALYFFFQAFAAAIFSEGLDSAVVNRFSNWIGIVAFLGFLMSFWKSWLGGGLLIVSWFISITLTMSVKYPEAWYVVSGVPLLIAGGLFFLSWWLSRKTSP